MVACTGLRIARHCPSGPLANSSKGWGNHKSVTRCSLVDGFQMDLSSEAIPESEVPQLTIGVFPGGFKEG